MSRNKSLAVWLVVGLLLIVFFTVPSVDSAAAKISNECLQNPQLCGENGADVKSNAGSDETSATLGILGYVKILLSLVFVLALLVFVLKFLNKRNKLYQQNSVIQNIGGLSVGPQKSVQILKIGEQLYVIGVGEDITLLAEIQDEQQVKELVQLQEENSVTMSPTPYIAELLGKLKTKKSDNTTLNESSKFNEIFDQRLSQIKKERSDELERWKEKENDKQ